MPADLVVDRRGELPIEQLCVEFVPAWAAVAAVDVTNTPLVASANAQRPLATLQTLFILLLLFSRA